MGIQDDADKVLKALFDNYLRTGINDFCNIDTISDLPSSEHASAARHLKSLGYVKDNVLGEFKLSDAGIKHLSN